MLQHSKLLITKIFQEKIFGSVWQKIFETKNELRWWRRWFVMCRRRVFSVTGIINKDILTVVASVMCWHQIWELFTLMNPSIMVMVSLNNINHNIQDSYWSLLQHQLWVAPLRSLDIYQLLSTLELYLCWERIELFWHLEKVVSEKLINCWFVSELKIISVSWQWTCSTDLSQKQI